MNFKRLSVLTLICFSFTLPFSLLADPEISVEPDAIEAELNTGDVEEFILNITNDGDEDLQFTIRPELVDQPENDTGIRSLRQINGNTKPGPRRDELGDVLNEYNFNQGSWSGLAWDGEMMNGITFNGNMVTLNPETGEIEEQIALNRRCAGLVFLESFFWTSTMNDDSLSILIRFNRNGNILETIETQSFEIYGIASDGENVYYYTFDPQGRRSALHQFSFENGLVRVIDCRNIFQRNQLTLEWVDDHEQGHLWAIEWNSGTLSQVDITGDEPELVQRTNLVRNQMYGISHDGVNLWYATGRGNWYVIDDGIAELQWISFEVNNGVLEPDSDIDVIMALNAADLIEGQYEADVHILSNDPENPDIVINVLMSVTGAPILNATWSEDAGFPDNINWNDAFADVFTGVPYRIPVVLINSGTSELIIESISCQNEVFTSDIENLNLQPGNEREIDFIFNSNESGEYEENMVIAWNNPNEQDFEIRMIARAFDPPEIVVVPMAIEDELIGDDVSEHVVNISNEGDALLRFSIETEVVDEPEMVIRNDLREEFGDHRGAPYRDDLGDILEEYNLDNGNWNGLAWDGQLMWGISNAPSQLVSYDPQAGQIVERREMGGQYYGLTFDGETFWSGTIGNRRASIAQIDAQGNILQRIEVEGFMVSGITFDGENLWYYSRTPWENNSIINQITPDGQILQEIDLTNIINGQVFSLTWVQEHEDGNLWLLSWDGGTIYQININGDQSEIIQQTQIEVGESFGIDHDGDDLWYCREGISWFKIDDGVSELNWLSVDPEEGEIDSGGDMDIVVTLNGQGLIGGMYEAELHILSNDPDNPDVVVSITVDVTGAPTIDTRWSEEFGYPDIINWNLAYEDLFTDNPYPITVEISNVGTEDLIVEEIRSVSEVYSANQEDFVLRPGELRDVVFTLRTEENGRFESEMVILSNDANNQEFSIPLLAETAGPPAISFNPNAIESDMLVGELEEHVINITNDGESVLRFTLDHEIIEQPDDDLNNSRNMREIPGPYRDDLGEVIAEYNLNQIGISDIAWDGDILWCLNEDQSTLFSYDHEANEVIETIQMEGIFSALDYDGESFWIGGMGEGQRMVEIRRIDLEGNLLQTIRIEGFMVSGITFDGENLWYSSFSPQQDANSIRQITTEGALLRVVNLQINVQMPMYCIDWVPEHENGHIWLADPISSNLYQLDVTNDNAEIVQQTEITNSEDFGITHDGEDIWYSGNEGILRIVDDGIAEVNWITYEPDEGEIEPDSDTDIILTLDATDLEPRDYEAELHIYSNDPGNPDVSIHILLHIEPNSVSGDDSTPGAYKLSAAYPNPFNATTRIEFTSPDVNNIEVNVYDITGQLVTTLFEGAIFAGNHQVVWNARDNANGVYLISLESEYFNAVQKVTLLK